LKIIGSTICKNKNSRVIIIGSVAGKINVGAPHNYSSAKSAIVNLMKNYVNSLAMYGISVNLINPGHTLTENGIWDKKLQEDPNGFKNILTSSLLKSTFKRCSSIMSHSSFRLVVHC
jgi:NAD(P)-dependent dehydrogenase (short-subunit alcohol dehydrogenase family)